MRTLMQRLKRLWNTPVEFCGGQRRGDTVTSGERGKIADGLARHLARDRPDLLAREYKTKGRVKRCRHEARIIVQVRLGESPSTQ